MVLKVQGMRENKRCQRKKRTIGKKGVMVKKINIEWKTDLRRMTEIQGDEKCNSLISKMKISSSKTYSPNFLSS